uniref:Uncharacterized protein n=1 Tax=viral metagenome TaxID=1070528 RepID=A0A6H1ZQV2_9ZZZZ
MAQVQCKDCGWQGDMDDMVVRYLDNPKESGDVVPEVACPKCGSVWLEDIDNGI